MLYLLLKAFHIIFMVSYFAGLFYLVRLFVYYKDTDSFAAEKKQILREQYLFMMRRLWNIIIVPAFAIMTVCGVLMVILNSSLLQTPWFHLKLTFLVVLFFYHYWAWKRILQIKFLAGNELTISNLKLRQFNEIATFLLFLIVITAILKSIVIDYWWQLILGFIVLVLLIVTTVKIVNKKEKS
ncbi:MAG: CopD family protein [Chryseobacterium sp.]|nr:CopD family protein [Chryseobacterium sp.]